MPASGVLTLDVPVSPRLGLYAELGGGNLALAELSARGSGYANFTAGLRTLVKGRSGPDSVILSTGLGLGYVWARTPFNRFTQEGGFTHGLLVHLGIDWKK
jgi:hypothetical protein